MRRCGRTPRGRSRTSHARTPRIPRRPTTPPMPSPGRSTTRTSRRSRSSTSWSTRRRMPTTPTTRTAVAGPRRGRNPCFVHPGDAISPGGGHWVDVRVKENDLPSLFGSIGLPLGGTSRARESRSGPALSGNKFLPLAVPNNVITKVQVRYYNECTSPPTLIPNSTFDLKPLPAADQAAFVSAGGGISVGSREPHDTGRRRLGPVTADHAADVRWLWAAVPAGRHGGAADQHRLGRHQPVVPGAHHREVRRLLPPALADPRVERRRRASHRET